MVETKKNKKQQNNIIIARQEGGSRWVDGRVPDKRETHFKKPNASQRRVIVLVILIVCFISLIDGR